MVDYDKYLIQALKMVMDKGNINNAVTIKDFENLYSLYLRKDVSEDKEEILTRITSLIGNIDFSFLDSPLGQVIGTVKFRDDTFSIKETSELLGVRTQYINQIREELNAYKSANTYLIPESGLSAWLLKKGKPSLKELKRERSKKTMHYNIEEENIIVPENESEVIYKPGK